MKELELYEVLPLIWEDLGKTTISVYELNVWCDKYQKEHPDVYLCHTRVDLNHAHGCNYIWHEIRHEGSDILHKQESIQCPCCNAKIYKYPNRDHYEKVIEMKRKLEDYGIQSNT